MEASIYAEDQAFPELVYFQNDGRRSNTNWHVIAKVIKTPNDQCLTSASDLTGENRRFAHSLFGSHKPFIHR